MTKSEFQKLGESLLSELPGFACRGQLLFMDPLNHTLRAIFFDGSGFDKNLFFVHVLAQPLFVPSDHLCLNLGWRIGGGAHRWDIRDPHLRKELLARIKEEALPFLSKIRSQADVATSLRSLGKSADPYVQQAIAYSLVRSGDVLLATEALDQLTQLLGDKLYPWQDDIIKRAEVLREMLIKNPTKAQSQLDEWESETLQKLKL